MTHVCMWVNPRIFLVLYEYTLSARFAADPLL